MVENNLNLIGAKIKTYQIFREIGRGGNAIVYLAHDEKLNRPVAIKMLLAFAYHPNRSKIIERFRRGAQATARLQHPNILPIYHFDEWQGTFYIVMQYVQGKTLHQHLLGDEDKMQVAKPLPLHETLNVAQKVGAALAHAHHHGVVHRDVKPSNIILAEDGHIYLTDFGLAHVEGAATITQLGEMLGTPHYMSPEQGRGLPVDHRTDIYSLAVVLFHMLTGRVPFHADTPTQVIVKHMLDPLPSPRSFDPDIPLMVEKALHRALAKNPSDRYQTVQEFIQDLEQAVASHNVKATAPAMPTTTGQPPTYTEDSRIQVNIVPTPPPIQHNETPVSTGGEPALPPPPPGKSLPQPSSLDRTAELKDYTLDTTPLSSGKRSDRKRETKWAVAGILLACLAGLLVCGTVSFFLQGKAKATPTASAAVTPTPTHTSVMPTTTSLPPTPEPPPPPTLVVETPTLTAEPTQVAPSPSPTLPVPTLTLTPTSTSTATPVVSTVEPPTVTPTSLPPETKDMIFIPAGDFIQGSTDAEIEAAIQMCNNAYGGSCPHPREWFADETPRRTVYLDAFYIDKWEVTNRQYATFVAATGYQTEAEKKAEAQTWRTLNTPGRENYPVVWMSWNDANAYCQWAGKRLPTEAEWEKAARGTDGRIWPWGSSWDPERANTGDGGPESVTAVGSYPAGASPYGLMDMTGNVWEWVADWYDPFWYASSPPRNPGGPPEGVSRALRGGAFRNPPWEVRATHRHSGGPDGYAPDHGFRCAQ